MSKVARYAWGVVAYNIAVILWGAYVRASGSGAGCGRHWPSCNGDVVPRAPTVAAMIEYSHRVTSGLALVAILGLAVWTFLAVRRGHPARVGAVWSVVFILTEAAVGAGLVLFQLVAGDASVARAMFTGVHLLNTFILLGWLTLTAWWLSGGAALNIRRQRGPAWAFALGAIALLVVSSTGAITALGDTLFPSASLGAGLAADMSASAHFLIRLRVWHPLAAVVTVLAVLAIVRRFAGEAVPAARPMSSLTGLLILQVCVGALNIVLLAPIWLQMTHLLVADATWIAFVLTAATRLSTNVRAGSLT